MEAVDVETKIGTYPFSCGALVVSPDGELLLKLRDNNPNIPHPDKWGLLGGVGELGETPDQTLGRELLEEANITLLPGQTRILGKLLAGDDQGHHKYIGTVALTPEQISHIRKGNEGQNIKFFSPDELIHLDLVPDLITLLLGHLDKVKKFSTGEQLTAQDLE